MSLFASAFDSGVTAGPSTPAFSPGSKNNHKRKRPSHGAQPAAEGGDQLRAAQKNLERLMKTLEGGEVSKSVQKEGRESMGMPAKKRKDKDGKSHSTASHAQPRRKQQELPRNKHNNDQQNAKHAAASKKSSASDVSDKSKKEKKKEKKPPVMTPAPRVEVNEEDTAGLTSLQKGMKAKLEGARFRWINEQLYTTPSTEAVAMMKKDPKIFADYHMTHRVLTAAWPSPPLPFIIDRISPLPSGTIIADLGCGDAGLARALVPTGKVVLSYDLVSDQTHPRADADKVQAEGWVVQADFISHVPLPGRPGGVVLPEGKKKGTQIAGSEIVDVVVCCLSLMGTNWVGGIYEACRILKQGGTFHVAEVTSRFVSTDEFVEKIESFGFKLDEQESPSTHFTLFKFTKMVPVPVGPVRGQKGWESRVKEGEGILQACVYKKR